MVWGRRSSEAGKKGGALRRASSRLLSMRGVRGGSITAAGEAVPVAYKSAATTKLASPGLPEGGDQASRASAPRGFRLGDSGAYSVRIMAKLRGVSGLVTS